MKSWVIVYVNKTGNVITQAGLEEEEAGRLSEEVKAKGMKLLACYNSRP